MKSLVDDMNLRTSIGSSGSDAYNQSADDLESLCISALRTVVGVCGMNVRLYEFFVKNVKIIEDCVLYKRSYKVRVAGLHLVKAFAITVCTLNRSSTSTDDRKDYKSTVKLFGDWIVQSVMDNYHEVAAAAFDVLREIICSDAPAHFHQERLPLLVSRESMGWIEFMCQHYSLLISRLRHTDIRQCCVGLRPVTYIALYMQQRLSNQQAPNDHDSRNQPKQAETGSVGHESINLMKLIQPMLYSLDSASVIEGAHCLLLIACDNQMPSDLTSLTNNIIDDAVHALLSLLDRDDVCYSVNGIMKDICSVINLVRDKYTVCSQIIGHISQIEGLTCNL